MSKCTEIREICGDYALDIEYSKDYTFTMFFNSRRNAETVKRCIEVDDSVPNVATAVDFVEVVRCKDCKYCHYEKLWNGEECFECFRESFSNMERTHPDDYCCDGERKDDGT